MCELQTQTLVKIAYIVAKSYSELVPASPGQYMYLPGGGNRPSRPHKQPRRPGQGRIARYQSPAGYNGGQQCCSSIAQVYLRDLVAGVESDFLSERHCRAGQKIKK